MELDMQWDGNPDIVLEIKTRVGVALPIQVRCVCEKNVVFLNSQLCFCGAAGEEHWIYWCF